MNKGTTQYIIGIILLIGMLSYFFYKSIYNDQPLNDALATVGEIHDLQVQLHRDLLRYRSNQIPEYDTLNRTLSLLDRHVDELDRLDIYNDSIDVDEVLSLHRALDHQRALVEDFKTHHSILQNSLIFIFNRSSDLYSARPKTQTKETLRTTAELITLLLQYIEKPEQEIAIRIYPLIDSLNLAPDSATNALINHSLMIVERLPEIDEIINRFNSLNIENKIIQLKDSIDSSRVEQENDIRTFNALLFLCTLMLALYILYIFFTLRNSQKELSQSNARLNDEIELRAKTEKALYQLVSIDKISSIESNNDDDRILFLLNALCTALDVEYAYISKIKANGNTAEVIGLLNHGMFTSNIRYDIKDTPCEEVIRNGRLVHNRDFANYFPDCKDELLQDAVSYIGIRLNDSNEKTLGMIAVASKQPIADTSLAENILTIATSRAIIELEYQIELNNNRRYQDGLVLIDDWIAKLITEGYDKKAFFKNICRAAQEITQTQLGAFPVLQKDGQGYRFISASGLQSEELIGMTLDADKDSICAMTILDNQNMMINDITSDNRIHQQLSSRLKIQSALLTPVTLKDEPYGAIAVFKTCDAFDKIDEQLMSQFSQSVQMAIINMQLVSDMRLERERAEVTLHSIADAVITTNTHGDIEYMNHVAESLTAWSLQEAKNMPVQQVFRIEDLDTGEPIHDVVMSCLQDGVSINKSVLSLVNKNGNKKDIESSISPILKTSGKAEGVIIVFHDETQRRQLEKTIIHQAAHDTLTNLLNRDAFEAELTEHIFDSRNSHREHVLCYLDLDNFKLINDTAGHSAGDQCLLQITSSILACIRSDDVLSRIGGDEFGLILKNCTVKSAQKITDKINATISATPFTWDGCDYKLGISIGINLIDKGTKDSSDALRKADLACYTAKDQGQNQTYIYEEQDSELIRRKEETYWATRIADTIDNDRLRLFVQPIVALNNKKQNNHVEILVRLLDDDQLVMPAAFIPAAERYNLMHLIDKKIIFEAFAYIARYAEHDEHNTHFSINLSGDTLNDKGIVSHIRDTLKKFDVNTKNICFEVTETAAVKNLDRARSLIKELKAEGFQFALDDFGSGLSSFQYLKNLPVDYLKIDGSFVADMVNNTVDHAMVAAINEVGHILGIKTIAEFVENEQIVKKLQNLKVDFGQGYGIEQPGPIEEILPLSGTEPSRPFKLVHNKP